MAKKAPTVESTDGSAQSTPSARHTTYEGFTPVVVHRSAIKNAPYNPRTISANERRKLKASLKKNKRLAPETWNVRTGNLVSGHQRLSILDDLEGTSDYTLPVAQCDLDDAQEKAANIVMNNPGAQGQFDIAKLEAVISTPGLDLEQAGLDVADVYRMFGDKAFESRPEEQQQLADQTREAAKHYDDIRSDNRKRNETEFYIVTVFGSDADRDDFIQELGLPDHRFQDGRHMRELFKLRQFEAPKEETADDNSPDDNSKT